MKRNWRFIILNSIKMIVASVLAITMALLFELEFAVSAGIVALLTILPTKKETIRTASGRLLAFGVALLLALGCYRLLGYTIPGFILFLIIFIVICFIFRWGSALTICSVIISHFLTLGDMSFAHVMNEICIFVIGVGMGVLANLHLRKDVGYIERLKEETDTQIKNILARMSERVLDKDLSDYNGQCLEALEDSIHHAKEVAQRNFNNQFHSKDTFDMDYIHMREKQCHVLYEMYKILRHIETTPITAHLISDFLKEMADNYHKENDGAEMLKHFYALHGEMKKRPLPIERKEFEDRAMLFGLMRKLEEFILIKAEFAKQYPSKDNEKI